MNNEPAGYNPVYAFVRGWKNQHRRDGRYGYGSGSSGFPCQRRKPHIIFQEKLSLAAALTVLKEQFGCERLTIQSGGTVNGLFLREKLFDFVDVVVAPALIGGKDTSTLIDGPSLQARDELAQVGVLRLTEAVPLQDSYLRLRYQVTG